MRFFNCDNMKPYAKKPKKSIFIITFQKNYNVV